ncbi:hypothetical protein F9288_15215 [Sphingomonas sp. CL5.1]|uniref:RcnB family protein n=1 Tax=Sphingomonas sp. CL5.1 TaxID=2653203 RepID=UPI0015831637|nr:RcnB family protein [Sphingomonas sp. CL5.1]QKS00821.1 hypothetical protein F9288_15215 [Sphingomonas sp. CL5.1]
MKKVISVTLMAAASLLPLSASAQEGWQRGGDRGGGAEHSERPQRQAAPGGWQRPAAPQAQVPQARPQPGMPQQQAPRPQWNGNRDQARQRWQQNGQPGGNWQRPPARPYQPGQPNAVPQRPDMPAQGNWAGRDRPMPAQGNWAGRDRPDNNVRQPGQPGGWQQARPDGNRGPNNWQGRNPNWQGRDPNQYNRDQRRGWNDQRRYGYDNRYAGMGNRGQWNRDWRRDNRYDWSRYRYQNRQAFHLPRYYAPYGWDYGYRRFSVGMVLSNMLFSQDYWIDDPYAYRLPEVYGPYRWVRYYNDAVLVDIYSGQVVDVIYDIFW